MSRRQAHGKIQDPLRARFKPIPEPSNDELLKGKRGTSAAGRTTVDEAKRKGFVGFLQRLGPGLITGASDDDPSGIGTYSQVGSQFGYGLLWTALVTFPLMSAVQELCARIALQTGVGLGISLRRKFPRWLVGVAILGLLVANTFNVGADLRAVAAGGALLSQGAIHATWLIVPVALLILAMELFVMTSAAVLHAHGKTGIQTAAQAAAALQPFAGPFAFGVFSVGMIGSGLLAIPILAGSASYALKEFLGLRGNLASKPRYRPTFYIMLSLATLAGVAMKFTHLDPIRALFIAAVINGVVAPPLLLLIVLLGRDPRIMHRQVSGTLSLALTGLTTLAMAVAALAMIFSQLKGG